jgi:thymidylate kinase
MFMRSISYYNHIESILKYNRGNIPDKIIIIQDRSFLSSYVYQNEAINNNLTDVMIDIGNIFSNITKQISKLYNVNITFHQHMFLLDSSVDVFESRNGKPRDEYENNLNVYNNRYKNIIQNTSILNWIKDSFNNFDYTIIEKNLSIEETQKIIYQNSLKYCNKNLEM